MTLFSLTYLPTYLPTYIHTYIHMYMHTFDPPCTYVAVIDTPVSACMVLPFFTRMHAWRKTRSLTRSKMGATFVGRHLNYRPSK
jgi:hypothetical protein